MEVEMEGNHIAFSYFSVTCRSSRQPCCSLLWLLQSQVPLSCPSVPLMKICPWSQLDWKIEKPLLFIAIPAATIVQQNVAAPINAFPTDASGAAKLNKLIMNGTLALYFYCPWCPMDPHVSLGDRRKVCVCGRVPRVEYKSSWQNFWCDTR